MGGADAPGTRKLRGLAASLLTFLALGAASTEADSSAPWPTKEWATSPPSEQGLDGERLTQLVEIIRADERYPDLHGLLIVKNGYLVLEEYFAGWTADRLHMQQSVTKSFTSALVGIAIAKGVIEGVDENVLGFFPDLEIANVDERKRAMRLDDLLTMRSGTDYHERGDNSPHDQLNGLSRGWDRFVLDRPMLREPGTHFQYDSGAVILTSSIIESRTGVHADRFAEPHLFEPLGIERSRWYRNREGHPHTGGGLDLRPRDMAKFGLLYLRGGAWEGRQVIPKEWVDASFETHVELPGKRTIGYGYWWWITHPDPDGGGEIPIYSARGFRAQYIFVVPEHDMVVVVTGGTTRWEDEIKPIDFLYTDVLPAVRR